MNGIPKTQLPEWSVEAAEDLYRIPAWGDGWLGITELGDLTFGPEGQRINLRALVDEVEERGVHLPLLFRFPDVLKARIHLIHTAFAKAMEAHDYQGSHQPVYPIKVNQNRWVVEDIVRFGAPFHHGLEAGSKPELLAVLAILEDPEALIICNGFKDEEYVEMALRASRLGPTVVLVAEQEHEFHLFARCAKRLGIRPTLGVRTRLATRGAGHWQDSGGDRSKFGLGSRELMRSLQMLRESDLLGCLRLLHFHIGSQVSSIRSIKNAVREASWIYVNLVEMGVPLHFLDVGGGLAIDYDGSARQSSASKNYSLQEYANDIVYGVQEICDRRDVPHPTLVTEAGRSTVAHHAVLVTSIHSVSEFATGAAPEALPPEVPPPVENLFEICRNIESLPIREAYHDALQYLEESRTLFNLGHLSLAHRVMAEELFWALCGGIREQLGLSKHEAKEFSALEFSMADIYYGNFSVFQSLPDSWAISQVFPIVPLERLHEKPTQKGILADITCDSDGKIDRFLGDQRVLDLHRFRPGEPYRIGLFLVGAYQEILGDLHNLLGDTHAIHVAYDRNEGYRIEHLEKGDTVAEVLRYVEYRREDLVNQFRNLTEKALREKRLDRREARELLAAYEKGLDGYTYLEEPSRADSIEDSR